MSDFTHRQPRVNKVGGITQQHDRRTVARESSYGHVNYRDLSRIPQSRNEYWSNDVSGSLGLFLVLGVVAAVVVVGSVIGILSLIAGA